MSTDSGMTRSPGEARDEDGLGPRFDGASGVQIGSGNVQFNYFYGNPALADTGGRPLTSAPRAAGSRYRGHAFISYVREDSGKVDALQHMLEAAGIRVWRDTTDLRPGEDWRMKIQRAITDDALVFIACFSAASTARDKSYQNEELALAIEQLRLRRPGDPWLIPVRFDNCDVPDYSLGAGRTLTSIQRADLFGADREQAARRLVASVQRLLRKPSPPPIGEPVGSTQSAENQEGWGKEVARVLERPAAAGGRQPSVPPEPTTRKKTKPQVGGNAQTPPSDLIAYMLKDLQRTSSSDRPAFLQRILEGRRSPKEIATFLKALRGANADDEASELLRLVAQQPLSKMIPLVVAIRAAGRGTDADQLLTVIAGREPGEAVSAIRSFRSQHRSEDAEKIARSASARGSREVLAMVSLLRAAGCRRDLGRMLRELATRPAAETAGAIAYLRSRLLHHETDQVLKIAVRRPIPDLIGIISELGQIDRQGDVAGFLALIGRRDSQRASDLVCKLRGVGLNKEADLLAQMPNRR